MTGENAIQISKLLVEIKSGCEASLAKLLKLNKGFEDDFKDVILMGVKINPEMFQYLSIEFYENYEDEINSIIADNPFVIADFPPYVGRVMPHYVYLALEIDGNVIGVLPPAYENLSDFFEIGVENTPLALKFTSIEWQREHILNVCTAIFKEPRAAEYVHDDVFDYVFKCGSEKERNTLDFAMRDALKKDLALAANLSTDTMKRFWNEVKNAFKLNPTLYMALSIRKRELFPGLGVISTKANTSNFKYLPKKQRESDTLLVWYVFSKDKFTPEYLSMDFYKAHPDLYKEALKIYPSRGKLINSYFADLFNEEIKDIIRDYPKTIADISEDVLITHPDYARVAVTSSWKAIAFVPRKILRLDKTISKIAIEANKSAMLYVPDSVLMELYL